MLKTLAALAAILFLVVNLSAAEPMPPLAIKWEKNLLTISGGRLPEEIPIMYIEAYCRPGSTRRDWSETVIPHKCQLISSTPSLIKLRDTLADGVTVDHEIIAGNDDVTFKLTAHNPTETISEAHWAQPCVQLGGFTGMTSPDRGPKGAPEDYLSKCFIYLNGQLTRMPTQPWAEKGFYTPGQEWCPAHVPRTDVNPRPLSELVPSNGLIGCFSGDEKLIFGTAWEPYQELFQGIFRCLHSDFRIGGLKPGERKTIRGKIYLLSGDSDELEGRYKKDFPEHAK